MFGQRADCPLLMRSSNLHEQHNHSAICCYGMGIVLAKGKKK